MEEEGRVASFRRLQFTLPYGLVVTASDVIEGLSSLEQHRWLGDSLDMILFGTECDLEVLSLPRLYTVLVLPN